MKPITKRLRLLRIERGCSQRDVAMQARIPMSRYWEIENGYRAPAEDDLKAIAVVLCCDPLDIVPVVEEDADVAS